MGKAYQRFKVHNSDHLTKLAILGGYVSAKNRNDFCKEYCINKRAVEKVIAIREQLRLIFQQIKAKRKDGYFEKENQANSIGSKSGPKNGQGKQYNYEKIN